MPTEPTEAWAAPNVLTPGVNGQIRGVLGGTELFAQPRHAETLARVQRFLSDPRPLSVEIGFDHGMRLLDHARRWPESLWMGLEIRKRRVAAAAPHAPPNCLLWAADARAVFSGVLSPGRVQHVYILYPTPATNPRHLLLTPAFVALLRRSLAPGGAVYVATDVSEMYQHIAGLFAGWETVERPPMGPVLSRRERVSARDNLPVYQNTFGRPAAPGRDDLPMPEVW